MKEKEAQNGGSGEDTADQQPERSKR